MRKDTRKYFLPVKVGGAAKLDTGEYGRVNMATIPPDRALQLYLQGFRYLTITEAGKRHYNLDADKSDPEFATEGDQPSAAYPDLTPKAQEESEHDAEAGWRPRKAYEVVQDIRDAANYRQALQIAEGYTQYKSVRRALEAKQANE